MDFIVSVYEVLAQRTVGKRIAATSVVARRLSCSQGIAENCAVQITIERFGKGDLVAQKKFM